MRLSVTSELRDRDGELYIRGDAGITKEHEPQKVEHDSAGTMASPSHEGYGRVSVRSR